MDALNEEIGRRIKQRRKELHLTQTQINTDVHISSGHMSDIENGKKIPSAPTLLALSKVLNCTVDWILTGISHNSEVSFSDNELEIISKLKLLTDNDIDEILNMINFKISKLKNLSVEAANSSPLERKIPNTKVV